MKIKLILILDIISAMQAIRAKSLKILTEGEKNQIKNAEKQAKLESERALKDKIHSIAQNWVNGTVATNIFEDKVKIFAKNGYKTGNFYVDLNDFNDELPGGVLKLPSDMEIPKRWNKDNKQLEDIEYTLNKALRSKTLREYIQKILDEDFPGMTIRIFADDFKNQKGDPNKFTIKLYNPNGKETTYKSTKSPKRSSKNNTNTITITAGRSLEEYEAQQAQKYNALNN